MNFEDYESLPTNNVVTHMTAGAIAGIMEHCVMYPLDSVKTRMQSLATSNNDGIRQTFLRMVRQEGMLRPVRGMSAMVVGAGPSHALYFSSYEYLKNSMISRATSSNYHTLIYGASGCISTLLHDGIMTPAEVVKQRIQMVNSPYRSVVHCITSIYRVEGLGAFYRSYTTQLTMNVPFQSIHFMVYEFAQKITNKDRVYNPAAHVVSGAAAGAVAAAITTPLDVCKTLLNTQQVGVTTGLVQAVKKVYMFGGPMGYFKGLQARVMYQMPATAICWSTYEFFKYFLSKSLTVSPTVVLTEPEPSAQQQSLLAPPPSPPPPPTKTGSDISTSVSEKITSNLKPRELPAMSGAGLYGSISFNTMHTATADSTSSCYTNNRRKDSSSLHDIVHT